MPAAGLGPMRRLMYIEDKSVGLDGPGRIGWVELSRTGRSYVYAGRRFLKANGYKWNCVDEQTGHAHWISGPRRDGADKLYGGRVEIDEDARRAYWLEIRGRPDLVTQADYVAGSSTRTAPTTRGSTLGSRGRRASR
jgi:hypothetical protein